ncbi:hypothetical protein [Rhizohabitans arisaemae]|uniref:hypothetical protein n=1 Tax=Rhizohabitans arisaemae TaxID=2720610 RepID=UPI0024B05CE1|nr:hypothetical protein [Rhizohabitans arisaemae]
MRDTLKYLEQFAQAVQEHGDLSAEVVHPASAPVYVHVRNRFSFSLFEDVTCTPDGFFLTSWEYRLGRTDNVAGAADRLAYLLAAIRA